MNLYEQRRIEHSWFLVILKYLSKLYTLYNDDVLYIVAKLLGSQFNSTESKRREGDAAVYIHFQNIDYGNSSTQSAVQRAWMGWMVRLLKEAALDFTSFFRT